MSLTYVILKVCKTETDSPIQKTNVCYQGEREGGEDKLGLGLTILTAIYKIVNRIYCIAHALQPLSHNNISRV